MLLLAVSWLVKSIPAALAALGVEALWLAVALIVGFPASRLRLLLPAGLGIASIGFSNWLLSENHGLEPAMISALRVAVFVLPGVLLASAIRTEVLADQLGQKLQLPARPVVAATTATSRLWELAHDWLQLKLVRQIRRVSRRNPIAESFNLASIMFVSATRGATQTAIAMEARGFSGLDDQGKSVKRTWAVAAKWGSLDWILPTVCLLVAEAVFSAR
jgi:energy-coupling factor transport system ATP-binding protein